MAKITKPSVGGQALIEGIMMRGVKETAVAVRMPDGGIYKEVMKIKSIKDKLPILKLPLLRGVAGFIESMMLGYKCLMLSAEKSGLEDLEGTEEPSAFEKKILGFFGDKLMKVVSGVAMVLGVLLSVVLFMYLPSLLFNGIKHLMGEGIALYRALFEGVLKIFIFFLYLLLVSRMKDIRRTFEYHGAEHKSIFCYECDEELTVENVRKKRRFHPRCGTSFMIVMMFVGIAVSFALSYFTKADAHLYIWVPVKILVVPVIMGLGYEIIKIAGKYDNLFVRIISAPGMWMQRLTTKEPDDSQIEVAITALKAVLPEYQEEESKEPDAEVEVSEESISALQCDEQAENHNDAQ